MNGYNYFGGLLYENFYRIGIDRWCVDAKVMETLCFLTAPVTPGRRVMLLPMLGTSHSVFRPARRMAPSRLVVVSQPILPHLV